RKREASGREQLDSLEAEARDVHRVLRVEPVSLDQLRPVHVALAASADQPLLLGAHVTDEPRSGLARNDRWRELSKRGTAFGADEQRLGRRKEQEQHRRIPCEGEAEPLAETVGDQVEIAGTGAEALWLRALEVMLERTERTARLRPPETDEELGWLEEDRHLVAIVLSLVMEAVDRRADHPAEDRPLLHEKALLVTCHERNLSRSADRRAP